MFSVSLILPVMGKWLDNFRAEGANKGMNEAAAAAYAGSETFMKVAIMPAVVLVVFIIIYVFRRKHYAAHKEALQKTAHA